MNAVASVAELCVIRHGQSVANLALPQADAAGRLDSGLTGRDRDVPLSALGESQAEGVGRWLAALPAEHRPEVAITSPYARAVETWRIAVASSGLSLAPPVTDERLVDRLMGDLELMTQAAVRRDFPDQADHLGRPDWFWRPPRGESFVDVGERLESFVDDLGLRYPGRRVVVVAHDAVVLMIRAVVEGLDWSEVTAVSQAGAVLNGSVTRFDGSSGTLVLDGYNLVDHLDVGRRPASGDGL